MGLKELIDAAQWKKGIPLAKQLPAKTLRAIENDLKEVAKVEKSGKPVPGTRQLADYFTKQYGVTVSREIVNRWYKQVLSGAAIR